MPDQITGMLADLADRLSRVINNPTADLTGTALLLAAVVLGVLILILAMLAWVVGPAEPSRQQGGSSASALRQPAGRSGMRPRRSRRIPVAALLWVAVAVVLVIELTAYWVADDTSTCLRCHDRAGAAVLAYQAGPHSVARCFECHASPGAFGGAAARLQYAEWLAGGSPEAPEGLAYAPDTACLRCHEVVLQDVVESANLRVRHADFVERYACIDCHRSAGHEGYSPESTGTMSRCLLCHDGESAAAECETCHVTDVSSIAGTPPERFPKVEMGPPKDCRGCHSIESCNACHGLEMPHSREFIEYGHAKDAAFDRKAKCFKCHSEKVFCNRCHSFPGHDASFKNLHGSSQIRCSGCHGESGQDFCGLCHGS